MHAPTDSIIQTRDAAAPSREGLAPFPIAPPRLRDPMPRVSLSRRAVLPSSDASSLRPRTDAVLDDGKQSEHTGGTSDSALERRLRSEHPVDASNAGSSEDVLPDPDALQAVAPAAPPRYAIGRLCGSAPRTRARCPSSAPRIDHEGHHHLHVSLTVPAAQSSSPQTARSPGAPRRVGEERRGRDVLTPPPGPVVAGHVRARRPGGKRARCTRHRAARQPASRPRTTCCTASSTTSS